MPNRIIDIDYTNHRGYRRIRKIQPTGHFAFTSSQWHPEPQWLFSAVDVEDHDIVKQFALSGLRHDFEEPVIIPESKKIADLKKAFGATIDELQRQIEELKEELKANSS